MDSQLSPLFKGLTGANLGDMPMAPCVVTHSDLKSYPDNDGSPGLGLPIDHGDNDNGDDNDNHDGYEWITKDTPSGPLPDSQVAPYINRETLDQSILKALEMILGIPDMKLVTAQSSPALLVRAAQLGAEIARIFWPGANLHVDPNKDDPVNVDELREVEWEDELFH